MSNTSEAVRQKLVIAISSSALFDMREADNIFVNQGVEAYSRYQIEKESVVLSQGEGFPLVKKLLAINSRVDSEKLFEVILLSRNSADTGLRVFNSIDHYQLDITRAAFCGGVNPWRYTRAFNADLFLSANPQDVREALDRGVAAATMLPTSGVRNESNGEQVRFAFDGDAVLFSDESEQIYKREGLEAFSENERKSADIPMSGGPFRNFLNALQRVQQELGPTQCPIRTALVTARAAPAHERVIKTLREWGVRLDESLFLGGMPKGAFLEAYGADVFFDDQPVHCDSASEFVATGHVPHGVAND